MSIFQNRSKRRYSQSYGSSFLPETKIVGYQMKNFNNNYDELILNQLIERFKAGSARRGRSSRARLSARQSARSLRSTERF